MTDLVQVGVATKRPTKKIDLKSLKGAWVEVYEKLNVRQIRELNKETASLSNNFEKAILGVVKSIKDWNLAGEDGQKLPVTVDSLDFLPEDDLNLIVATTRGMTVEELEAIARGETVKKNV